jgi:2-oxoacid:acceptor oxidoreductase delta subunit (pyruvate/2-ketoisovalerate family)
LYKKAKDVKGHQDLPPMTMTIESSLPVHTGPWRTFRPVIDKEKCNKCFLCWRCCPEPCIEIKDKDEVPVINLDYCKGCGICANECPKNCIELVLEETE